MNYELLKANIKIMVAISLTYFIGYLLVSTLMFCGQLGVLIPLGFALIFYLLYGIYYFFGLIILNGLYVNKIPLNQPIIYASGFFLTSLLAFFLFKENRWSNEFFWTIFGSNVLTFLLIYFTFRIFKDSRF